MLQVIRGRLHSWHHKSINLGGRIVLVNSVLSSICSFYLSFMKMPVKVWKEVVKWSDICKPMSGGGLSIMDLRAVNVSLLSKGH